MLHNGLFAKLRAAFVYAAAVKCRTVATDKLEPPGTVFTSGSSALNEAGRADSAKNLLVAFGLPFNDSACGLKVPVVYYGRTTPVGGYTSAPMGSMFYQVAADDTDANVYIRKSTAWTPLLTGVLPVASSVATTALAGTRWDGMRVSSEIPTGVTCAGENTGLYIETAVTGTGVCTGSHYGLKIETYVTSLATMSGDHYGIGVYTYSDIAGNCAIDCLRLEHNGASVANSFLCLQNQTGKMRYLITSSMTNESWMSIGTTPTCGTAGGWYRVKHGGYTRYIQLYTSVS
jgi:hypothetical protein